MLNRIRNFLSGRTQQGILDGCASDFSPSYNLSDGPQGTVLGPWLLLCFITLMIYVPECVSSRIYLYADDVLGRLKQEKTV